MQNVEDSRLELKIEVREASHIFKLISLISTQASLSSVSETSGDPGPSGTLVSPLWESGLFQGVEQPGTA